MTVSFVKHNTDDNKNEVKLQKMLELLNDSIICQGRCADMFTSKQRVKYLVDTNIYIRDLVQMFPLKTLPDNSSSEKSL